MAAEGVAVLQAQAFAPELSSGGRRLVLAMGFLAWMFAGLEMALLPLTARPAVESLLRAAGAVPSEELLGLWFSRQVALFLIGAAAGGFLLGRVGDRRGRVQSMAWSVLCYSFFTLISSRVRSPEALALLRLLAGIGVGGTWPAAVSLVSEAWPKAARPVVAGILGSAANVGIFLTGAAGRWLAVTPESWRWAMVAGGLPAILGLAVFALPESPQWLSRRSGPVGRARDLFRPPLLGRALLGILLGTVPLLGAWASGKWLIPWADYRGGNAVPGLKGTTQAIWAAGAVLGSFFGGILAHRLGRRRSYFVISLGAFVVNLSLYSLLHPLHPAFQPAVFLLGFVGSLYFGWLPLCLPELFPTRVRATGSGLAYNFGRILSAAGVLGSGALFAWFAADYAKVGQVMSGIYALGMVLILIAPDLAKGEAEE
jgi:MFS family permease